MSGAAFSFILVQVCLALLLSHMAVSALSRGMQKYERNASSTLGHMFKHTVVNTAVACCVSCSRNQGCRGVSYNPDSGRCELNWWADGTMPTLYNTPGVHVYIKKCPVPWVLFEGHCYLFSMTARNWTDSRDYCADLGTQLVDIQSVEENTFVRNVAIELAVGYLWIGIGDVWGTNTWINGQSVTFTDYYPGQPASPDTQDCVAIVGGYGYMWADWRCYEIFPCSCKTVLP